MLLIEKSNRIIGNGTITYEHVLSQTLVST